MSATKEAAFGVRTLTRVAREFDTAATDTFFTKVFEGANKETVEGRTYSWDEDKHARTLAAFVDLRSPTPRTAPLGKKTNTVDLIRVAESTVVPWDALFLDRDAGSLTPNAPGVIRRNLKSLVGKVTKSKEWLASRCLQGAVTIAPGTPSGTDITASIDYGIPTLAKVEPWNVESSRILGKEIPAIQAEVLKNSGIPVRQLYFNDKIHAALVRNEELAGFAKGIAAAERFLGADVTSTEALRGLRVADVDLKTNAYGYKTEGGVYTRWIDDAKVICLPEQGMLSEVLTLAEGKCAIPTGLWGPAGDVGIAEIKTGLVSYAERVNDPVGVRLFCVWFGAFVVEYAPACLVYTAY